MGEQYLHDLTLQDAESRNFHITVTRRWVHTGMHGRVEEINLIIVDKYDNRAQCSIPYGSLTALAEKFKEGHDYIISNFSVKPFNLKYRCFENDFHIVLHENSVVTALETNSLGIPKDVFVFTNLKTLADGHSQEPSCLIDVVGFIEHLKPFQPVDGPGNEKHFYKEFYLTDLIHRVCVRFWDSFALHFDKQFAEEHSGPPIVTISSCKIVKNQFNGEITLRNVEPTRLYFKFRTGREDKLMKRFWEVNGLE